MKAFTVGLIIFGLCSHSVAAQKQDYWYKVESESEEKNETPNEDYTYDSLDQKPSNRSFKEIGFWSLRPKFGFGFGFHADKSFFETQRYNRFLGSGAIYFANTPTRRWTLKGMIIQNNSFIVNGNLEFTPKRTPIRLFYGFGLAHKMVAEKEFSNLVDRKAYYATGHIGYEFLLENGHGIAAEAKLLLSFDDHALQFSSTYIIPL